jgi:hypothetical protein
VRRTTALIVSASLLVAATACRPESDAPRDRRPNEAGSVVGRWHDADADTTFVRVRLDAGTTVTRALDHAGLCPLGSKYPVCDA